MTSQEENHIYIKFEDGDLSLNVRVDYGNQTVWLSMKEMSLLYDVSIDNISLHIKNILKEGLLDIQTSEESSVVQLEGDHYVKRKIKLYNLDMIAQVGYRTKAYSRINLFKEWVLRILHKPMLENGQNQPLIVFRHNEISLDVRVSPDEDTVWLTKEQITILFDTTRQNVDYHINNIYTQNELEEWATCKEILQVQIESGRQVTRSINMYNLDMIISLGYRINSLNGIIFRKWANKILKEYLLKGHVINDERCLACASNIASLNTSVMSLQNKVESIEYKVKSIEDDFYLINSKAFFEGEILEPSTFIRRIFFLAKNELIITDCYADNTLIQLLKDINIKITIITSTRTYLNNMNIPKNITIIRNDEIHGRYVFVDDKFVYTP